MFLLDLFGLISQYDTFMACCVQDGYYQRENSIRWLQVGYAFWCGMQGSRETVFPII
jgi:hypothetical protein